MCRSTFIDRSSFFRLLEFIASLPGCAALGALRGLSSFSMEKVLVYPPAVCEGALRAPSHSRVAFAFTATSASLVIVANMCVPGGRASQQLARVQIRQGRLVSQVSNLLENVLARLSFRNDCLFGIAAFGFRIFDPAPFPASPRISSLSTSSLFKPSKSTTSVAFGLRLLRPTVSAPRHPGGRTRHSSVELTRPLQVRSHHPQISRLLSL